MRNRYVIRSNGEGKFWVIDTETNLPTTTSPLFRAEAVALCELMSNEEVTA
jgi:hypothetical protein